MKKFIAKSGPMPLVIGCLLITCWPLCAQASAFQQPSVSFSGMPLFFEPQEAAVGEPAGFLARGQNYHFLITPNSARIALCKTESDSNDLLSHASRIMHRDSTSRCIQMEMVGSSPYARIRGDGPLGGKMNYLIGSDSAEWRTALPVFSKVQLEDVYPGINLIYYGNQHQLEYDFVIAPHADPENIALHFDGVDKIEINRDGELVLTLAAEEIRFHRPVLYQEVRGARQSINGAYQFKDARTVAFSVGQYDQDLPLIIDPVLSYSTYFGGNFGDLALGVKVFTDTNQNSFVYLAGETLSRKFPFTNFVGSDPTFNGGKINGDAFVAKLSADASNLVYFTYIGGSEDDGALDLAVDASGNAFITGFTDSTNFPTLNAAFPKIKGFRDPSFHTYPTDAFVTELDPNGGLVYSTYLGGSRPDVAGAIALDSSGNAYITGYTYSGDFPTNSTVFSNIVTVVGYTNRLSGSNDIFVAEIGPSGQGLLYMTLFGGTGLDAGEGIAADDSGHVYVAGYTGSTNFYRTPNALPGTNGLGIREINGMTNAVRFYRGVRNVPFDAFLARFNTALSGTNSVEYSTLFGGKNNDAAFRIALYSNTDVIITGNSRSPDFPTNFPFHLRSDAGAGNSDAFLARFHFDPVDITANPPSIVYSTLFGGASEDVGWDLSLDAVGNVYVVGTTASADFPTTNGAPFLHTNHIALRDVFVTAFSNDASGLIYSVEIGGNNEDFGYGIAVDPAGSAYIVGRTVSKNFPVTNASSLFMTTRYGTNDAFLAKISSNPLPLPPPPLITSVSGNTIQLSWPVSASGYVLEANSNFKSSSGWVPVSGYPITTNGGFRQVQIPTANGSQFFRLRK